MDRVDQQTPLGQTIHLILDPVSLHHAAEVAVWLAGSPWRPFGFHWLPTPPSWLSFVEAWFAIRSKTCRQRSEVATAAVAEQAILGCITTSNTDQAHSFTWRKGVHFSQRLTGKPAAERDAA
ncbi:MAG: transposase [Dehalococcoidia bacterium]